MIGRRRQRFSGALELNDFVRVVLVTRSGSGWVVFHPGSDGKRRPARGIVLPPDILEFEIRRYPLGPGRLPHGYRWHHAL